MKRRRRSKSSRIYRPFLNQGKISEKYIKVLIIKVINGFQMKSYKKLKKKKDTNNEKTNAGFR